MTDGNTTQQERTRFILAQLETMVVVFFYTLVFIKFSQALYQQPNVANAIFLFD